MSTSTISRTTDLHRSKPETPWCTQPHTLCYVVSHAGPPSKTDAPKSVDYERQVVAMVVVASPVAQRDAMRTGLHRRATRYTFVAVVVFLRESYSSWQVLLVHNGEVDVALGVRNARQQEPLPRTPDERRKS